MYDGSTVDAPMTDESFKLMVGIAFMVITVYGLIFG